MELFKPLLSPKTGFFWDHHLEEVFERFKTRIIKEIETGVEIFDPARRTCLSPEWSMTGVGHWLHQKHRACNGFTPGAVPTDGVSGRILRDAERRDDESWYSAVVVSGSL